MVKSKILVYGVKAFEKSVFGPCTLVRTWGTRPEPKTLVLGLTPPELTDYGIRVERRISRTHLPPGAFSFRWERRPGDAAPFLNSDQLIGLNSRKSLNQTVRPMNLQVRMAAASQTEMKPSIVD